MLRAQRFLPSVRLFSTSSSSLAGQTGPQVSRAIVFSSNGDPKEVLKGHTYTLPELQPGGVRLRYDLSAINPADLNVIQGVYPSKPAVRKDIGGPAEGLSICGNEGTGVVEGFVEDGEVEKSLKIGDRVRSPALTSPQVQLNDYVETKTGTWQSHTNLPFTSLIPVTSNPPISPVQAATLAINPPTALRMLTDFVPLDPESSRSKHSNGKQWVIQNGANSAVGTAVIQIAKSWGVGTINLVRDRDDLPALKEKLTSLGADHVLSYSELLSDPKVARAQIKDWTSGGALRLALNCVGGKETTEMVKLLDLDGTLVTYGGMAKEPLKIPPSLFIFKKLTTTGFWLSDWVETHAEERVVMMSSLAQMVADGKLVEPAHEIVELRGDDEHVGSTIRGVMKKLEEGRGKKMLIRFI
ncbi:hypothetical protein P7C70_g6359, partial [Phenoliferia sp. Uapishka_3]